MRRAIPPVRKGEKKMKSNRKATTALQLILAWGLVGIPLGWGVSETVLNAMRLFH